MTGGRIGLIAGILVFASLRAAIMVAAYFATPYLPVQFLPGNPITALDVFPAEYWTWNPGFWLTPGHLILILLWPAGLTARRLMGKRPALIAALLHWAIIAALLGWLYGTYGALFSVSPLPPVQVCAAFIGAMGFSEYLMWRNLFPRPVRVTDAAWIAGAYSALFNALIYGQDPTSTAPRLIIQTLIYMIGAGLVGAILVPLTRTRRIQGN